LLPSRAILALLALALLVAVAVPCCAVHACARPFVQVFSFPPAHALSNRTRRKTKPHFTVLAGYDQVQLILFGKKYGGGEG